MTVAGRKAVGNRVPVHSDNAHKKDWVVLLEASTIVGKPRDKLRVALTTQERKIVKRYRLFSKTQYFLIIEGYDPRIHALFFCPQLYRYDDDKLVPLGGDEIGRLMVQSLQGGATDRQPWYEPTEELPGEPVLKGTIETELDSVVVNLPTARSVSDKQTASDALRATN